MTEPALLPSLPPDGRQSATAIAIQRGLGRLLRNWGMAPVPEVPLPDGRRADMMAIGRKGEIWIIEIKSSLIDFRTDQKWQGYAAWCDRLFFAVNPDFPAEVLPQETGLMVCDAYGGSIVREASDQRLAGPTRKTMMLLIARLAATRLHQAMDPDGAIAFEGS